MFGFIKRFAQNSMEHPSFLKGLLFIVLPIIVGTGLNFFLGINAELPSVGFVLGRDVFLWIASAALLYILIFFLKGTDVKGNFTGILTSLSHRGIFSLLWVVLSYSVLFFAVPEFISGIAGIQATASGSEEAALQLRQLIETLGTMDETLIFGAFGILLFFGVLLFFSYLYLVYSTITVFSKEKPGRTLLVLLAFILVQALFFLFL